jgi:hypothetical protein
MTNFILAGVAEDERLRIMERTVGGRVRRAKEGLPWAGHLPFGRNWRKTCGCAKKCRCGKGEWFVDERGRALAALLERYVRGGSLGGLAPEFGFYDAGHVQRIIHESQLSARPYVAVFDAPDIGLHEEVPVPAIPPVIGEELHERVKARMLHNRNWNRQALRRYVLAGFLRCSVCGYSLYGCTRTSGHAYYNHHRESGGGGRGCPFRNVPAPTVEGPVLDYLYRLFLDQPAFDLAVKLALPPAGEREAREVEAGEVERELAEVGKGIAKLAEAVARGADLLIEEHDRLKARRDALRGRLTALRGELEGMPDPADLWEEAEDVRAQLATEQSEKDWRKEPFDDVRRFLHFLFGDNPRKEGLGVFVNLGPDGWGAEIKARLKIGSPYATLRAGGREMPVDVGAGTEVVEIPHRGNLTGITRTRSAARTARTTFPRKTPPRPASRGGSSSG